MLAVSLELPCMLNASAGGRKASLRPTSDGTLLLEAADTLTLLASRADQLSFDTTSDQVFDQLETALQVLRRAFSEHATAQGQQLDINQRHCSHVR